MSEIISPPVINPLIQAYMKQYSVLEPWAVRSILAAPTAFQHVVAGKGGQVQTVLYQTIPGSRYTEISPKSRVRQSTGPTKCKLAIVATYANALECRSNMLGAGDVHIEIAAALDRLGISTNDVYYTTLVKHKSDERPKSVSKQDIKEYLPLLKQELAEVDPELVVILGAKMVKAVFPGNATYSSVQGRAIEADSNVLGKRLVAINDPASISYDPSMRQQFELDMNFVNQTWQGTGNDSIVTNYQYCKTFEEAERAIAKLEAETMGYVAVDTEWAGKNWLTGELRCIQFTWTPGESIVLVLSSAAPIGSAAVVHTELGKDPARAWDLIRRVVSKNKLVGHFIRADLPWLVKAGIDINDAVIGGWDTGLAGHLLNENWDQGLEVYTSRYTNMGRYDRALNVWIKENGVSSKLISEFGYASIPDEILFPYAAADTDATFRIFFEQLKEYEKPENAELFKLFKDISMPVTLPILELEMTGMSIDKTRLESLSHIYTAKRLELKNKLQTILNWPEFNPDSPSQKVIALYGGSFPQLKKPTTPANAVLGTFTPTKTTKTPKQLKWEKAMAIYIREKKKFPTPSTDKLQLKELLIQNKDSELLRTFLAYTAIAQIVKSFTGSAVDSDEELDEDDDEQTSGGLLAKTWGDGRIRTRIRQTVDTGRYGHSDPNMSQLPKNAEEFLAKIFANDPVKPASIRSCFVADPGMCFLDCDWTGAELYVMAWLSGDKEMQKKLLAEGADFHSDVAIDIFKLTPKPTDFKGDSKAWLKVNNWIHFRTITKTIVFGIAYGRGAAAVQLAVYLEGVEISLEDAQKAIQGFNETFPVLANWLKAQQEKSQKDGFVVNGFGRRRRFDYTTDPEVVAHQKRQAMNAPIQGTVGDLMSLALCNLYNIRRKERPHLRFSIVMSVHDQILLLCPIDQLDETMAVLKDAMCERCRIPNCDLLLKADPDICLRWGEELTEEDAVTYPVLKKYVKTKK